MKLFIRQNLGCGEHAGFKAPADVETILIQLGFTSFELPSRESPLRRGRFIALIKYVFQLFIALISIPSKSVIVFQIPGPFLSSRVAFLVYRFVRWMRGVVFVGIVHDVETLRNPEKQQSDFLFWRRVLSVTDSLIVHNGAMKNWFGENLAYPVEQMVELGLFDYCLKDDLVTKGHCERDRNVVIAGNLMPEKSGYVYQLSKIKDVQWRLFGPNFDLTRMGCPITGLEYCGAYSPEELPQKIDGEFGLIWDGDSLDDCVGKNGQYLKYNNPHKASLYIVSGLPLIVWRQSAIAQFVEANKIGILIDSLFDVGRAIRQLSTDELLAMRKNVEQMANDIRHGKFLTSALREVSRRNGR